MKPLLLLLTVALVAGFTAPLPAKEDWIKLYNGKDFTGWDMYLGPPLDDAGKQLSNTPLGLNNDPDKVFTVVTEKEEKLIRISGEHWGGISTKKEYENFHLQLQFKWGKLTWKQNKGKKRDSGLLYFAVGRHGADYGAWMRSQEFQIQAGDCGDYWGVAGGMQDIKAVKKDNGDYIYNKNGQLYTFGEATKIGRHCIKGEDAEKPLGEWNTVELYCHGDTSVHVMNGKVVMVLYHSAQWENGQALPLTKGKLQIQSEGAEVYYKNIRLRSIKAIPAALVE